MKSNHDYLPVEQLREVQARRLQKTVDWVFARVLPYRARMIERGVSPDAIADVSDIRCLPFTDKDDLRAAHPFGYFAVPLAEVVRIHSSSGTLGRPTVAPYTREDLSIWAGVMARTLSACGVTRFDVVQNAYGYGLFTGGLGVHSGAERLGAAVIPASAGHTSRQIRLLSDLDVTVICCTPTYFIHLAEVAEEQGLSLRDTKLRIGAFGAEPWSEEMRRHIEAVAGIEAFDIYGLSEVIGPGVATECVEHSGLHVFEDHFYPEVVNPATGEVVPDGDEGELVLTTLTKRAMPLIRYRTHDVTRLVPGQCPCGRTLRRIQRINCRTDDVIIVRGVKVFPREVESALLQSKAVSPNYQIVLTTVGGLDQIQVRVERSGVSCTSDGSSWAERVECELEAELRESLGVRVQVELLEQMVLPRSEGKAQRIIDQRGR
jgi:phenylacetate-CoA ligase